MRESEDASTGAGNAASTGESNAASAPLEERAVPERERAALADDEPESLDATEVKTALSVNPPASGPDVRGLAIERRASSMPPSLVHAIFEVSPEQPKVAHETPPPPPAARLRSQRPSLRVSKPPPPPRPSGRAHAETEEDGSEPRFSLLSSAAVPVLSAPPTDTVIAPPRESRRSGPWLAIGAGALLLVIAGAVVGFRTRGAPAGTESAALAAQPAALPIAPAAAALPELELPNEPPGFVQPESVASSASAQVPATSREEGGAAPAAEHSLVPAASPASTLESAGQGALPGSVTARAVEGAAPELPAFDAKAASSAITAAFGRAAACRLPTDPSGAVTATLTYAPSGRVTNALVTGPFAGTRTGGCIAGHLRSARIPAFAGDYTTVRRNIVLK